MHRDVGCWRTSHPASIYLDGTILLYRREYCKMSRLAEAAFLVVQMVAMLSIGDWVARHRQAGGARRDP